MRSDNDKNQAASGTKNFDDKSPLPDVAASPQFIASGFEPDTEFLEETPLSDDEFFPEMESDDAKNVKNPVAGFVHENLDATRLYLNEIGCSPLLNAEQEVMLSRQVRQGDAESKKKMIESNLRLVVRLARNYLNKGLCFLDLVEEGNLGLIRAVEKFDPELGYRFSTYATWWIKQNIERALINQTRIIRLPVHVMKDVLSCERAARELAVINEREASAEEIAEHLDKTIKQVKKLMKFNTPVYSADAPLARDSSRTLLDTIADRQVSDPAAILEERNMKLNLDNWLDRLSRKQSEIVARRFGLRGYETTTLENVGKEVGLTRERVRQIQMEALAKLRRMLEREGLSIDSLLD
ncbi:MAG: RNA polymerase sigma factor RpoS [Pseudomonadales bacterium]|nr:RNA polymerase sigma factor RpoS [Pseudomonadales bacterium]